jgi:hypothetical protein
VRPDVRQGGAGAVPGCTRCIQRCGPAVLTVGDLGATFRGNPV